MKILTLNTWQERGPWQERWEVIFGGLNRFRPEIVAFQELFNAEWAQEIQKRTGYAHLFFPKEYCGLAVYSQYPASSWGVAKLIKSSLEEYLRYALWAVLEIGGHKLFFVNTHLSWKLEDGDTRLKQAKELNQLVKKKNPRGESVIVGDLNAPPHSPEIRQLMVEGGFLDVFHRVHQLDEKFTWDNRNPYASGSEHKMPDRRIDFILAHGQGSFLKQPVSCEVVFTAPNKTGVWASDHYGILAEFK